MATKYKITFKNHCTPQEYLTENGKWYLESNVGAKFTGGAVVDLSTTQPVYSASTTLSASPITIGGSAQDFVFIKNLGSTVNNVLISLDGETGEYRILLAPGESFAAEMGIASAGTENNDVWMRTNTGAQTVQTLRGT